MFLLVGSSTVCALLTILHEVLVDMGAFSLNCRCTCVHVSALAGADTCLVFSV